MERITFCASCGEPNSVRAIRCESCDAPLRKVRDWRGTLSRVPRPSPLALLVFFAGVALLVAILTWARLR